MILKTVPVNDSRSLSRSTVSVSIKSFPRDWICVSGLGIRYSLEQIHREFIEPLDKSQSPYVNGRTLLLEQLPSVSASSYQSGWLDASTDIKKPSKLWISLRQHLKALNRDIYYAQGIEWRIEKGYEKITDRDAYNKLHAFQD